MSWLEYRDLQERLPSFQHVIALRMAPLNVGAARQLERAFGFLVSGNYFSALGLHPATGRFIEPGDAARPGGEPVIVISHEFWQTRFGGSPDAIGQPLRVNDRPLTDHRRRPRGIPRHDHGRRLRPVGAGDAGAGAARWIARARRARPARLLRHRPVAAGCDVAPEAQAELDAAMRDLAQAYPATNAIVQGRGAADLARAAWPAPVSSPARLPCSRR